MTEQPALQPPHEPQDLSVTQPPARPELVLSSVGTNWVIRARAFSCDIAVIRAVAYPASVAGIQLSIAALAAAGMAWEETGNQADPYVEWFIGFLVTMAYFVVFEWLFGATPGKLLFQQRVVQLDGSPCRLGSAVVRAVLRLVDGLFFGLVAYQQMKGPLRQRLGDHAAHTLVVPVRDPFIKRARPLPWLGAAAVLALGVDVVVQATSLMLMYRVVPREQLYAQLPAAELNVKAEELGEAFELQSDAPLELSFQDFREGNSRWFYSTDTMVVSSVLVYKVHLLDPEEDLVQAGQSVTREVIATAQDFKALIEPGCADRGSLQGFSSRDGQHGFILAMEKRNVLLFVLSVSPAATNQPMGVGVWGCAVVNRIR